MSQPEIPSKTPAVLELEPGTYWWCACGRSKTQPWCDGSHAGTTFEPMEYTVSEKKRVALCNCKHTGTAPLCDGNHRNLP
ncbi:MAG: CDGSH iron-sulfur domain-containing protein [Verrucomicrobia bacterium]|nr:MAG: CDGSH iron-sulfur domain-containing protein [Verrucomicrobiota bacterium]